MKGVPGLFRVEDQGRWIMVEQNREHHSTTRPTPSSVGTTHRGGTEGSGSSTLPVVTGTRPREIKVPSRLRMWSAGSLRLHRDLLLALRNSFLRLAVRNRVELFRFHSFYTPPRHDRTKGGQDPTSLSGLSWSRFRTGSVKDHGDLERGDRKWTCYTRYYGRTNMSYYSYYSRTII